MSVLLENSLHYKCLNVNIDDFDLNIVFTKDKNLIQQFLELRNNIMFNELNIKSLETSSLLDDKAEFLLVLNNNQKVIAGCKFLYSQITEGKSSSILSQEVANTDFLYEKFLPTIDLRKNLQISELSNLVIDNNYRLYSKIILQNLFAKFIKELQNKVNYCFWATEIVRSRFYKKIFSSLNVKTYISIQYPWFESNKYPSRNKNSLCQNYVGYVKFF
jgi:hypothetical protein